MHTGLLALLVCSSLTNRLLLVLGSDLSHMPWLAVPFASPERTATPAQFQVSGIPHLKVFGARGQLLDNDAIRNNSLSLANLATWERGVATAPAHQHSGGGGC